MARGPWAPAPRLQRERDLDQSLESLRAWIGRTETVTEVVSPTPFAALAATLDWPAERPAAGTPLPPLWHWIYCVPLHTRSELGADGHARRGGFVPPVPLPRRMWAGGQLSFAAPLRVGDAVRRVSRIDDVVEKKGQHGTLIFVRVRHQFERGGEPALTEFQDIVYREERRASDPPPNPRRAPAEAAWRREWTADDVLLFRYSALTFNAHRIHYDRRYVTAHEGYPGLVVHGPLTATLLLDLLRRQLPAAQVASFDFRALHPLFDGRPFQVCGQPLPDGRSFHLWAQDHDGWLAMDATAVVR